jgi:transposase
MHMATTKYLALDVHQATCAVTVRHAQGRILERGIVKTNARELVALLRRLGPNVHVTFEEGTQAEWLHDLLSPHCAKLIVCNPRENRSKRNKSDRVDADQLSELLRLGSLKPVFHHNYAVRPLKELVRAYNALVSDAIRVMLRIKAIYRARLAATPGKGVYRPALRREWLDKIAEPAARKRAELFLAQLDAVSALRLKAKTAMLREAKKHPAFHLLQSFPAIGPVRAAEFVAIVGSPHRFRTKRQLWPYAGLAVVRHSTADHLVVGERIARRARPPMTRGLNSNSNRELKKVLKTAAVDLSHSDTPLGAAHRARLERGIRKELALLTLARTVAAILLSMWKKGVPYDPQRVTSSHASVPAD